MSNKKIFKKDLYKFLNENYETTPEELEDPVVSKVSYPVFEDELKSLNEYFDELNSATPYGEDNGVITPEFVKETPARKLDNNDIYHKTLSSAIQKAEDYAAKRGYTINPEEMFTQFGTGGVSYDTTKRASLTLYKDGVPQKKMLHMQVYRMPSGNYELNDYINEKHLETPEEHNEYEEQVKLQTLANMLTSDNPEIKQLLQILYTNGLFNKLLKLKSGKRMESKDQVLNDIKVYVEKLDDYDESGEKAKMLELINSLMPEMPMEEMSCGCDEMNENVKSVSTLLTEALDNSTKFSNVEKLVSFVLYSQIQVQNYHRQTKSFSEHKALNDYYDEITDLVDGFIESYQGKHGIIKRYTNFKPLPYKDNANTIKYFENLYNKVDSLRKGIKESYLQNQIDTIQELIESTIYKLTYLK